MTEKKSQEKNNVKPKKETAKAKYFYAVGRRKSSVAQVFLYHEKKAGEKDAIVNKKSVKDYFPSITLQKTFFDPLKAVGMNDETRVSVLVKGGGKTGQAEASRLGIARALVKVDENFKKTLKGLGFLTRDSRRVERKKPGLKKARRAPQWKKR